MKQIRITVTITMDELQTAESQATRMLLDSFLQDAKDRMSEAIYEAAAHEDLDENIESIHMKIHAPKEA